MKYFICLTLLFALTTSTAWADSISWEGSAKSVTYKPSPSKREFSLLDKKNGLMLTATLSGYGNLADSNGKIGGEDILSIQKRSFPSIFEKRRGHIETEDYPSMGVKGTRRTKVLSDWLSIKVEDMEGLRKSMSTVEIKEGKTERRIYRARYIFPTETESRYLWVRVELQDRKSSKAFHSANHRSAYLAKLLAGIRVE